MTLTYLDITPEFHWTDQKVKVHYFCCVLGYLFVPLIGFDARKDSFKGSLDTFFDHQIIFDYQEK